METESDRDLIDQAVANWESSPWAWLHPVLAQNQLEQFTLLSPIAKA